MSNSNRSANNPPSILTDEGRTDAANAKRFALAAGDKLRYVPAWGKWMDYDQGVFRPDQTLVRERLAKFIARAGWNDIGVFIDGAKPNVVSDMTRFARHTSSERGIRAMLRLAQSEPTIVVSPDVFDRDPWLFNVQNGTIDLRTGKLKPHDPADYLTKCAPIKFDPDAACPLWEMFLDRIMGSDQELIGFLQRLVGLAMIGTIREHILPIAHGTGANGKSVFTGTVQAMFGDYAMTAPLDLLMVKHGDSHPTERADLFGKRFVACVETADGRRLDESLVKSLTGGDKQRVRRMREDFWEFTPSHTLFLATNHMPRVVGRDHGIWRRLRLIPFTVTIPDEEQDKELPEKLLGELSGILNWSLAGCLAYQQEGLKEPPGVLQATAEYRTGMDSVAQFISECCIEATDAWATAAELHQAYTEWCDGVGERPISKRAFGQQLAERDHQARRGGRGVRIWDGIGLLASIEADECVTQGDVMTQFPG